MENTITIRVRKNRILKADLIRGFIETYNPRRRDLTRFIVVNINGIVKDKDFNPTRFRGYYSVNLKKMREAGNIKIVDGRYQLTDQANKHTHSLYHTPNWKKVKELKAQNKRLRESNVYRREENAKLWRKIHELKQIFNDALDKVEV